jgi:catechol 2,3-dioxygenase-like lactoylglutathione lyase family enzyme
MKILRLDHLVLTVADRAATCDFYQKTLGFEAREKEGRWALHFGQQKINLHQVDHTFDPKAARPTPGSGDLCFITETDPEETVEHLRSLGTAIVEGPVARNGALGAMTSVYCRDPDGNLVEIAQYD